VLAQDRLTLPQHTLSAGPRATSLFSRPSTACPPSVVISAYYFSTAYYFLTSIHFYFFRVRTDATKNAPCSPFSLRGPPEGSVGRPWKSRFNWARGPSSNKSRTYTQE